MTKESTTLWQSNFITSARYEMTALEKNILYLVVSQIKKEDSHKTVYTVSATEIAAYMKGESVNYNSFKKATEKLLSRILEGTLSNGNLLQVAFVSSAEYIKNKGLIEIELSQKILPYYLNLTEKFTTFELQTALNLNSIYSKRIYELISQYKNLPNKSFKISLKLLKETLGVIELKTGKDKYENFSVFKKNVLDPAFTEINGNNLDVSFTYEAIEGKKSGKGRKPIEFVEFVIENLSPSKTMITDYKIETKYVELFERLTTKHKLRKDQATEVLDKFSYEEINKNLYAIWNSYVNKEIKNIGAYTASTFNLSKPVLPKNKLS